MARLPETVEEALTELQRVVRMPVPADPVPTFSVGQVPDDLATKDAPMLHLTPADSEALVRLRSLLPEDQRFEHMDKSTLEAATWRFVCLAHFKREENHVEAFCAEHAREPMRLTCFFPVEDLTAADEIEAYGVRFIPADKASLPPVFGPGPRATMASVIAVDNCTGTDHAKIALRAREPALHALRILRAVLREEHFVHDRQLRFRLGESTWFSDGASIWASRPEQGWPFELSEAALRRDPPPAVSALPLDATNSIERSANRALRWWEQAQLAVDPIMELLLLTFALEAILGRKSDQLKARNLAIRRAILGHKITGNFTHPARFYLVYDRVRSVAVHGGEPPRVDADLVNAVAWDVRRALNEFLDFARAEGYVKRTRVLAALDSDPGVAELVERFIPED